MEPTPSATEAADPGTARGRYGVRNYDPLPVVVSREGSWVEDVEGRRHFDALSAYSALNWSTAPARLRQPRANNSTGYPHPARFGRPPWRVLPACRRGGLGDRVLPMNTGAEAVETAIKAARKWGYEMKGIAPDRARIVVCQNNFHGRATVIVCFSDDPRPTRRFRAGHSADLVEANLSATRKRSTPSSTTTRVAFS